MTSTPLNYSFIKSSNLKFDCNTSMRGINRMISPSPIIVLANRITRNLTNKILANCIIKRGPLRDDVVLKV